MRKWFCVEVVCEEVVVWFERTHMSAPHIVPNPGPPTPTVVTWPANQPTS